jgi:hypothetical protein
VVILAMIAGCGRIAFDAQPAPGDAARGGDGGDGGGTGDGATTTGLVAWWKLDEGTGITASDSVGSADGMLKAGASSVPSWTTGRTGTATDHAASFIGNGDHIELGTPPSLTNMPAMTVSAWVKPSSVTAGASRCLFDKGLPGAGWALHIAMDSNGDVSFTANYSSSSAYRSSVGNVMAVGSWKHVVMSWDGSMQGSGVHLYVDGTETAYAFTLNALSARPDDSPIPANLSCDASTGLIGALDDVRIYNRVLTAGEIAAL